MDAPTKIRSPFSTEPRVDEDGVIYEPTLSEHDDRLFEILGRYEYLTIPYIAGLSGRSNVAVRNRLAELKYEPSCWVRVADWQRKHPKHFWFSEKVYELGDPGVVRTKDRGFPVVRNEFTGQDWHRLMSCQVRADFEYGLQFAPGVKIIPFHEMQGDPRMPSEGRKPKAYLFPAEYREKETTLRFDTHPFVIERPGLKNPHLMILGIEVDRSTMPQKSHDAFRSAIHKKVVEQIGLLNSGIIKERFGFPAGYIMYVNPSPTRLREMMEIVKEETKDNTSLRRWFLFQTHKDSTDKPVPTGRMLTEPHTRVEYPPLSFIS